MIEMDIEWATKSLAFLISNPRDAEVILGEHVVHGWARHRDGPRADAGSYVAGFSDALAVVGVVVAPEVLSEALERGAEPDADRS
jgi:hypothetical protein